MKDATLSINVALYFVDVGFVKEMVLLYVIMQDVKKPSLGISEPLNAHGILW